MTPTSSVVQRVLEELGVRVVRRRGTWGDAACPLHQERKPSFSVNLENGAWVCRHGGLTGSLARLVAEVRGGTPTEARDWFLGLVVESDELTTAEVLAALLSPPAPVEVGYTSDFISCRDLYESLPVNRTSRYILNRGFTPDTLLRFGVRYDPDGRCLLWPSYDDSGELVGFTRRFVDSDVTPKYRYTQGFRRVLFPTHLFNGAPEAILVEGPLDAMWLHQLGYGNALALLGSSLEDHHVSWLTANVQRVTVCLDNDQAGRLATEKVVRGLCARFGVRVASVQLPAKDVQELDAEGVELVLRAATSVLWI